MVQHHYLLNSSVINSEIVNDEWYISKDKDPVLDAFNLYDKMIQKILLIKVRKFHWIDLFFL